MKSLGVSRETFGAEMSLGTSSYHFTDFPQLSIVELWLRTAPDQAHIRSRNTGVNRLNVCVLSSMCISNYITHIQNI